MKNCPYCGALLTAALVDAIINPSRSESCPKAPKTPIESESKADPVMTLAAYALLGSLFREGLAS